MSIEHVFSHAGKVERRAVQNSGRENSEVVGDPGIEPGVSRLGGVTVPCHTLQHVAQTLLWRWIICPARGVNGQIILGRKK